VASRSLGPPPKGNLAGRRWALGFAEVTARDLDIPILGQPTAPELALCDLIKASSMEVVSFEATLRGGALIEQGLEHPPVDANRALVVADADTEFNTTKVRFPSSIRRKREKHRSLPDMVFS